MTASDDGTTAKPPSKPKYSKLTPDKNTQSSSSNEVGFSVWSWDYWQEQFDHQRLQRLEQCRALQDTLKACEANHSSKKRGTTTNSTTTPQLDEFGGGIRMLRYYKWRDQTPVNQKGCIPEKHAMWSCRAIALACGKDMGLLRDCFDQQGIEAVVNQKYTSYEVSDKVLANKESIPCFELQRNLGDCVAKNARDLQEKIQARKKRWRELQTKEQQP